MNIRRMVRVMAAVIAAASGCMVIAAGSQREQSVGSAADRDQITAIVTRWETAWNTHDMTAPTFPSLSASRPCGSAAADRTIEAADRPLTSPNTSNHLVRQTSAAGALADAFVDAWNTRDVRALGRLCADEADWVRVGGERHKGRVAVEGALAKEHASWAHGDVKRPAMREGSG